MGWQIRVPPEWRPLRIAGEWPRGHVIIGSANEPAMQIRWWRPNKKRFDARRWMQQRLRSLKARDAGPEGPAPSGFTETAWAADDEPQSGGRKLLRTWYGYAPDADLVLEVTVNLDAPNRTRRIITSQVVPSLAVSETGRITRWSVFGASFESPAGFSLLDKRLALGDLVLRFRGEDRSCLMLRQVYPAETALARRKIERWIEMWPFKEHRRYRKAELKEVWRARSFGRMLEGIKQPGRKRLPLPLGFCAPRATLAVAVVDTELDRLLIAEHDAPARAADEEMLATAIARMNWAILER
ncbi:MAG: hypothetical protein ABIF82_14130 [Planctomycetota bacterium]